MRPSLILPRRSGAKTLANESPQSAGLRVLTRCPTRRATAGASVPGRTGAGACCEAPDNEAQVSSGQILAAPVPGLARAPQRLAY